MATGSPKTTDWLPGLDGLRAVAVGLVIAFHLQTREWVPGGFIGVDLFFVVSGFLITKLLLEEHAREGRVDLGAFYLRRLRRLVPALVATLVLVSVVSIGVLGEGSRNFPSLELWTRSTLWSLFYGFNWLVAYQIPYMHPLVHVWSLSIEEQFYLVWPLALMIGLHVGLVRNRIRRFVVGLISLSLLLPLIYWDWIPFWHWGGDWRRLYYGSDYRAHAMLAGCLLALYCSEPAWRRRWASSPRIRVAAILAAITLAAVAATATLETTLMYLGGFAVVVSACVVLVLWAISTASNDRGLRLLESKPMVWIGRRSYGLYLYHMPLVVWTRELDLGLLDQSVLVLVVTFLLAEASYRWLERPVIEAGRTKTRVGVPVVPRIDPTRV